MPSAYLISYSRDAIRSGSASARRHLDRAIPDHAHEIATLLCSGWQPPPPDMCRRYSGVSRRVQDYVMRDPRAVRGVQDSVDAVLTALRQGHDRVVLLTMCLLGTHRSVTAAEVIGRRLAGMGVRVHVRHPHRRRRAGDAY